MEVAEYSLLTVGGKSAQDVRNNKQGIQHGK
jgi:hypothetical protein